MNHSEMGTVFVTVGQLVHRHADRYFDVSDGELRVVDGKNNLSSVYAAGKWDSVDVRMKEGTDDERE